MRAQLSRVILAGFLILQVSACDTINDKINDAIPEIAISGGVMGLNGETGTELSGQFADAGKSSGIEAVAALGIQETVDDVESGDFSKITRLETNIGLALQNGDVALTLSRGSAAALPEAIHATNWTLDWVIFDANHPRASGVRPPGGSALNKAVAVTFTRQAGCAATAASCGYTASNAGALLTLFPIEVTEQAYLDNLMAIIGQPVGASNTPNNLELSLRVTVTETAAQLSGLTVTLRVGEYDTSVTPVIFG